MLLPINAFNSNKTRTQQVPVFNNVAQNPIKNSEIKYANTLSKDTVNFTGKSAPSLYKSVFQYLAAEILGSTKKYKVDGSKLSATNVKGAVENLFEEGNLFLPYKNCDYTKIKWKSYIPEDIRIFSVDKINEAREARMNEWLDLLNASTPEKGAFESFNPDLISKLNKNPSLRLVIWDAVSKELRENNRHIPVPVNETALMETIKGFEKIAPKERAVRCVAPSFLEMYTHRLRDNLLMDLGLSDKDAVWVKIPSIKHEPKNKEKNINMLEILSCRNWCTRSSVDKAEAALEDGDFYIYLQRNKFNQWEPLVGMTTAQGKIDQIQGIENNNIVPLTLVNEIKTFIAENKLKCHSSIVDEGPKATQAIMISDKLNEVDEVTKHSFAKVIKNNDAVGMFNFLGVPTETLEDGMLKIGTYKPVYSLNAKSGISVPYSMFGLDENVLLDSVKVIDGDLNLYHRNKLFESRLSHFPANLEEVTGRIHCSAKQYEQFAEQIDKLVGNSQSKLIIHN